jgi:hypothetical protein
MQHNSIPSLIPVVDNPDSNMKTGTVHSSVQTSRHMEFRSRRTFELCSGQLERLKPFIVLFFYLRVKTRGKVVPLLN